MIKKHFFISVDAQICNKITTFKIFFQAMQFHFQANLLQQRRNFYRQNLPAVQVLLFQTAWPQRRYSLTYQIFLQN